MIVSHKINPGSNGTVGLDLKFSDRLVIRFVCGFNEMNSGFIDFAKNLNSELFPEENIPYDNNRNQFSIYHAPFKYNGNEENYELIKNKWSVEQRHIFNQTLIEEYFDKRFSSILYNTAGNMVDEIRYNRDMSTLTLVEKKITWRNVNLPEEIHHNYVLDKRAKWIICTIVEEVYLKCKGISSEINYKMHIKKRKMLTQLSPYLFNPIRLERLAKMRFLELVDFVDVYLQELGL